jgi:hypothetical protein
MKDLSLKDPATWERIKSEAYASIKENLKIKAKQLPKGKKPAKLLFWMHVEYPEFSIDGGVFLGGFHSPTLEQIYSQDKRDLSFPKLEKELYRQIPQVLKLLNEEKVFDAFLGASLTIAFQTVDGEEKDVLTLEK